jgi:hypothetical protein
MKLTPVNLVAAALLAASTFGCTPPPVSGTITCDGGAGMLNVSPAVSPVEQPVTYSLRGPSTTASCTDGTGTGITSARLDSLAVTFRSLSCFVTVGTRGSGPAVMRWSDGTTSDVRVTATLDSAFGGTIDLALTSGHFAGRHGSTQFNATPAEGSCFDGGITRESISIGATTFTQATDG